ncbi:MAG: peptide ABC transporter substrate-binding protein, partial [Turicibacter bilis]
PDSGDMLAYQGLNWTGSEVGNDAAAKEAIGLYEFQALKDAADAVVDDNDKRFELYAKAEAFLLDNAIFIPYCSNGGGYSVSKLVPRSGLYGAYGLSDDKYKYKQVADEVVTKAQRDEIIAEWQEELKK